jgi:hypothetical protein
MDELRQLDCDQTETVIIKGADPARLAATFEELLRENSIA